MIKDGAGGIYWMMQAENGVVKVMRAEPQSEMGSENFIKTVYQIGSAQIYFLLYHKNHFYLMDENKTIRILKPNEQTLNWK